MTDKTQWSTDEKVRIVLQTLDPQASMANICRQHDLAPRTVYGWKERFLVAGRGAFDGSDAASRARHHKREVAALKRIIGEYAVAIDALKKTLEGDRD